MAWYTKNNTSYKTDNSTAWRTKNNTIWLGDDVGALWNDLIYIWNDSVATWDSTGDASNWYNKNMTTWEQANG